MVTLRSLVVVSSLTVFWAHSQESEDDTLTLLWPIHMASLPLSSAEVESLEPRSFGQELSRIGLDGFLKYLNSTLPQELMIDQAFASDFHATDHSRVNLAFQRWQKRACAEHFQIDSERIAKFSGPAPKLDGVKYSWPELYDSPLFEKLRTRIVELTRLHLARVGHKDLPESFLVFPWVEVFRHGDSMRPSARTEGAYISGQYFASGKRGAVKLNFEDPRGINPPYGRTFSHAVFEGNLVLFPPWVSYIMTPNMSEKDIVCFSFMVYPADGSSLDWQKDHSSDIRLSVAAPKKTA